MKSSCRYCGRIHDNKSKCQPPARKWDGRYKKGTRESRFRNLASWGKKRQEIRERDNYLCKVCASTGVISYEKIEVHHIEPLSERYDLRLEDSNLICLCQACHEKAERGLIPRGTLSGLAESKVPPLLLGSLKRK